MRLSRPSLGNVEGDIAPALAHFGQGEPNLQRLGSSTRAAVLVAAQYVRQRSRQVLETQAAEGLVTLRAVRCASLEL